MKADQMRRLLVAIKDLALVPYPEDNESINREQAVMVMALGTIAGIAIKALKEGEDERGS